MFKGRVCSTPKELYPLGITDTAAGLNRGKAAIEFDTSLSAENAARCMDGGVLDGEVLKVTVRI